MSENFETRIERWKRNLLDLSMRNPLLSLRQNSGIEILSPNIWQIAQSLHDMEADFENDDDPSIIISPTPLSSEGHVVLSLQKSDPSFVSKHKSLKKKLNILSSKNDSEDLDDGDDDLDVILRDEITSETHVAVNKKRKSISTLNESEKKVLKVYGEKKKTMLVDGTSKQVFDQLTRMRRTNQSREDDTGTHVLFLAVGMLTYLDGKSERSAPLILIPVSLEKTNSSSYKIKKHADEVVFNPALEYMLTQQYDINWSSLHDCFNKDRINFSHIKATLNDILGNDELKNVVKKVSDDARVVLLSYAKHHMWNDIAQRMDEIKDHHFITSMLNLKTSDDGWSDVSWEDLDKVSPDSLYLPLPADASQIKSIMQIDSGVKSLIIEGPPGTGKSQTITNMIAHLLTKGKRVLFVAEKLTALGVVHDKLKELSLGAFCLELHTQNSSKVKILQQLEEAVDARHAPKVPQYKQASNNLQESRRLLNESIEALHEKYPNSLSIFSAIGLLSQIQEKKSTSKRLMLDFPNILAESEDEKNKRLSAVERFCFAYSRKDDNTLMFDKWFDIDFDDHLFWTSTRQILSKIHAFNSLISRWPIIFNKDRAISIDRFEKIYNTSNVFTSPTISLDWKLIILKDENINLLNDFKLANAKYRKYFSPYSKFFKSNIMQSPNELWHEYLSIKDQWFLKRNISLKKWNEKAKVFFKKTPPREIILSWCSEKEKINKSFAEASVLSKQIMSLTDESLPLSSYLSNFEKATIWRDDLIKASKEDNSLINEILSHTNQNKDIFPSSLDENAKDKIYSSWEDLKSSIIPFKNLLDKSFEENVFNIDLDDLYNHIQDIIKIQSQWPSWKNYAINKKQMIDGGLGKMVDMIESKEIPASEAKDLYLESYYNTFIHLARMKEPQWIPYQGSNRELAIENFQEQSEEFEKLTQKYILSKIASRFKNVPDEAMGEMNILKRELMKKSRHMPTRRLIYSLPHILPILKPCLMMSPLSVAEYLSHDVPDFDVVIFDEASQIQIADALGAISRAKQIVIVGDPKQMPPSRMFSGTLDDDDWSEDVISDMDSILTESLGSGVKSVTLNWHYRSRHEQLIAFSNKQYYNGELITFPSIDALSMNGRNDTFKRGIFVHQIDGVYDRGASATNQKEAIAVVDALEKHLLADGQNQSIGVVTFNQKQQVLIERLWDEKLSSNPQLKTIINTLSQDVAIKNLENVQGDERDVILFSTTFGKGPDGRMLMNFGPLGQIGGERRFNVAITRARNRMDVFCSFYPHDIDLSRVTHQGIRDLRQWLSFAKGESQVVVASQSLGLPDSPFELCVINALKNRGFDVVPQVGSSGYKIDIAVLHPKDKSTYIAAIECDGATYHSFKTARDRDRSRQLILEGLGWNVIRIWSTDWFENKEREIQRVHDELDFLTHKSVN